MNNTGTFNVKKGQMEESDCLSQNCTGTGNYNYDAKLPGYISMISELYLYLSLFSMSLVLFLSLCGNGRSFVLSVIDSVVHSAELK